MPRILLRVCNGSLLCDTSSHVPFADVVMWVIHSEAKKI